MDSKTFFQSKTNWFGIGQIVFGIIGLMTGWVDSQTATTLLMTGLATVGLRLNTSSPISGM